MESSVEYWKDGKESLVGEGTQEKLSLSWQYPAGNFNVPIEYPIFSWNWEGALDDSNQLGGCHQNLTVSSENLKNQGRECDSRVLLWAVLESQSRNYAEERFRKFANGDEEVVRTSYRLSSMEMWTIRSMLCSYWLIIEVTTSRIDNALATSRINNA